MYSAIKVNGKKLYEYARKGKKVEVKDREIEIYKIELLEINQKESEIIFKVECSKGTYIRTLCENIAEKLNTVGYMKDLKRIKVGEFQIENTICIEKIKDNENLLKENLISIENFFKTKLKIELNDKELVLFLNGVNLNENMHDDIYRIYNQNKFIGIGVIKNNKLKRDVIVIN